MSNIYGPYLKSVREEQGLKAAYVAAKIHISPPTYLQIENGRRGLKAERLQAIANVLGITFGDLDIRVHGMAGKAANRKSGTSNRSCGGKQDAV
jgi:transcriptional regulator with XRE-family HTH domain